MSIFHKLNQIVIFQISDEKADNFGGRELEWRDYFQTWAAVKQLNNLSPQMRSHNFTKNFYKFTVRAQHKINLKMRIIMDDRIFYIENISSYNGSAAYKDIITYEKVKYDVRT